MSVLEQLAERIVLTRPTQRTRVAIDGVDASGKSTLADRLAQLVELRRPVVRASVDGFHRPRAERYRRGRESAEGCYHDTFDLETLRSRLLEPFAATGTYLDAAFDHVQDQPVDTHVQHAPEGAALILDGVFLQRPELAGLWDLVVHLQVPDDEVLRRAVARDDGVAQDVERLYRSRYLPAQRLYEAECQPAAAADVVLENSDPEAPVVLQWVG